MSTDNYEVLKYRVEQLENMMKPLIEAFNNLDKKVGLLAQKIVIATFIVGSVFQGFGVWYSVHGDNKYTEGEKITYHESRISNRCLHFSTSRFISPKSSIINKSTCAIFSIIPKNLIESSTCSWALSSSKSLEAE